VQSNHYIFVENVIIGAFHWFNVLLKSKKVILKSLDQVRQGPFHKKSQKMTSLGLSSL